MTVQSMLDKKKRKEKKEDVLIIKMLSMYNVIVLWQSFVNKTLTILNIGIHFYTSAP